MGPRLAPLVPPRPLPVTYLLILFSFLQRQFPFLLHLMSKSCVRATVKLPSELVESSFHVSLTPKPRVFSSFSFFFFVVLVQLWGRPYSLLFVYPCLCLGFLSYCCTVVSSCYGFLPLQLSFPGREARVFMFLQYSACFSLASCL